MRVLLVSSGLVMAALLSACSGDVNDTALSDDSGAESDSEDTAEGCGDDCTEPNTISSGTLTVSFHGGEPMESSGDDPAVAAELIDGRLYFSADNSQATYGMNVGASDGPAPYTTGLEVGLIENVNGTQCSYQGSTQASITALDFAGQAVAGNAALTMVCMGGGCDFGCNAEFDMTVDFDLNWVASEL